MMTSHENRQLGGGNGSFHHSTKAGPPQEGTNETHNNKIRLTIDWFSKRVPPSKIT